MCGFAGFFTPGGTSSDTSRNLIKKMRDTLLHRGPDDGFEWVDADAGIAMGFRRLAILDLSVDGRQPMQSPDGRYVITFNGEIYNFQDLTKEIEKEFPGFLQTYKGHSDTRIVLALMALYGFEATLQKLVGMFAIALWDRKEKTLWLARDRTGEKPLYYGWSGKTLVYGSELKALKAHPDFDATISKSSLALYFRHGYVPAPYSIFEKVQKLPAGGYLKFDTRQMPDGAELFRIAKYYWNPFDVIQSKRMHPLEVSEEEALSLFEKQMYDTVSKQMIADVPLGAFLSGGVDSSLIVSIMSRISTKPVKTFTIGFDVTGFNEAPYARKVAEHLKTEHHELYVSPQMALDVVPKLPQMYDEPFADSSQIPTHLVSAMTRKHVTVSLSGDGGDELFGGYPRYFYSDMMWSNLHNMPRPLRKMGSTLAHQAKYFEQIIPLLPVSSTVKTRLKRHGFNRLANTLNFSDFDNLYLSMTTQWHKPTELVPGSVEAETPFTKRSWKWADEDIVHRMMFLDFASYLSDDILVKVDRASMSVSLESRAPFLDHRLVELAWSLPLSVKYRRGTGKWIMRKLLEKYVPTSLTDRPKMGFGVPIAKWLRTDLKDWASELLSEKSLQKTGLLNSAPITKAWQEHLKEKQDFENPLWSVLMFQAWQKEL